jgi:hypothetical protein
VFDDMAGDDEVERAVGNLARLDTRNLRDILISEMFILNTNESLDIQDHEEYGLRNNKLVVPGKISLAGPRRGERCCTPLAILSRCGSSVSANELQKIALCLARKQYAALRNKCLRPGYRKLCV